MFTPPRTHTPSLNFCSNHNRFPISLVREAFALALVTFCAQGHTNTLIEETVTNSPLQPFYGDVTIQPTEGSGIYANKTIIDFDIKSNDVETGSLEITSLEKAAIDINNGSKLIINSAGNNHFTSRDYSAVHITNSTFNIKSEGSNIFKGSMVGLHIEKSNEKNQLSSTGNTTIIGKSESGITGSGINLTSSTLEIKSNGDQNHFEGGMSSVLGTSESSLIITSTGTNHFQSNNTSTGNNINALNTSSFNITGKRNEFQSGWNGITSDYNSAITIVSTGVDNSLANSSGNIISANNIALLSQNQSTLSLISRSYNKITSNNYGVYTLSNSSATLSATNNTIETSNYGIRATSATASVTSTIGNNTIISQKYGIYAAPLGQVSLISKQNNYTSGTTNALVANNGSITFDAQKNNELYGNLGVNAYESAQITLTANDLNRITSNDAGIFGRTSATVQLLNANTNTIVSGYLYEGNYGTKNAIHAQSQSKVVISSSSQNLIYGAIRVDGGDSSEDQTIVELNSQGINTVQSFAVIEGAGDLDQDTNEDSDKNFKDKAVIGALYAAGSDAQIKLTGRNQILTYADDTNKSQLERTVWAYDSGSIELDGWTLISTDRYDTSPQSLDVAIAAGTAVNLTDEIVSTADAPSSSVTVSYEDDGAQLSHIEGDVLAAYDGSVKVQPKDASSDGLSVKGNLLAGNKGELSLNLGKGGELIGRADSYMDADGTGNDDHTTFFDPAFSSTIYRGGTIDLNMGEGSTWTVTGQSWVTNLSGHGTINLVNALEGVKEDTSHALHVQNLSGKHTFVVNLNDSDHSVSDMLYINNVADGSSEQVISIDSFEGLGSMAHLDRIRFATVNASNSDLYFVTEELNPDEPQTPEALARASRTQVRDVGFYDVGFRIESETRLTDTTVSEADDTYDGKEFNTDKPGKSYVDTVYGSNEEDAQNWYLVRDKSGDSTSDGGETILAMARAVYWNAVEIDRLNKRLGDARHANGGTDGFWVRVRNDRIGTDAGVGDFRSRNYAYQFGYDHTKKENDGKRLFGAALDYMDGNTTYRDIEGTGATDRFGVTAYMTWLGDDGWYYDLVGKWGVLSNSFRITSDYGVFVDGDYDNHVLGASFEFGRKLTKENSPWFLEPQAQIQHVMVTEASYSTNQGTHVDQDKINSTITRLGFRIGRNFGEKQSGVVYAKADWLKEWHGHQGIKVTDTTTGNTAADVSIDNKGNWFDVGFGVQSPITDTTYFFADAEYVFGNDLDNTWNFNAGVRWMFH